MVIMLAKGLILLVSSVFSDRLLSKLGAKANTVQKATLTVRQPSDLSGLMQCT